MLAPALGRNIGYGAFQNLQQRLLHAFAGNVAGDGGVLVFAADLVDFVNVDDAGLRARHVAIGGLQQLEDDVLHVLADVAGFGQSGGVHDGEGNVEHLGQGLRQQRLAGAGGANQHDVRLGQLDFAAALPVHVDPLVVVVNRHRELLLGLLLADDVLVEEGLHLGRLGKLVGRGCGLRFRAVVFQNGVADGNALIADVGARIIGGRRNQLGDGVLRLVAKRTAQYFVGTGPGSHSKTPLPRTLSAGTPRSRAAFPVRSNRAGAVLPL